MRNWPGIALLLLLAAAGCGPAGSAPESGSNSLKRAALPDNQGPAAKDDRPEGPFGLPAGELLEETWDAVHMGDAPVGYIRSRLEKVSLEGRELRRLTSETSLTIERFGQSSTQAMRFASLETPAGELVRFECRMSAGPGEMFVHGAARNEELELVSETLGNSQTAAIPWDKSWGGFAAVEQSLRRQPLAPGETRELRGLMPDFPFPAAPPIQLAALSVEPTALLSETRELLKIRQTIELAGGQKIESYAWTDPAGVVLKSQLISGLSQTTYRTTREIAQGKRTPLKFDLGVTTTVRLPRPIEAGRLARRVVYRAKLSEGDPAEAFVSGPTQTVRSLNAHTAEIVVRALRPDRPERLEAPDAPPTEDDLASNGLIQSDDANVLALARAAAPSEQDPWRLAVALEKHIKRSMRETNFSQAFATAAETAVALEGDCTEHAMLLAAVCRARGIPARMAVGLVYDGKQGFAFHMWTEAWIVDRWVPLDATRGAGGIDAGYLKLAHTNLKVASITTALYPVFSVLGRLELEIVDESP